MHKIAIVYDFDGTLCPDAMQDWILENVLKFPRASEFWNKVNKEAKKSQSDPMLTYVRLLIEELQAHAQRTNTDVGPEELEQAGENINYFPGVEEWFKYTEDVVQQACVASGWGKDGVKLDHYIVSAGLVDILRGTTIHSKFERVFATEFHYSKNADGLEVPQFLTNFVNGTAKTQYLFRINKGILDTQVSVDEHMPEEQRDVPFRNMIYLGDGATDVPSMAVIRRQGGHAAAVYRTPKDEGPQYQNSDMCKKLLDAGRIDFYAEADYKKGSRLASVMGHLLRKIVADIRYRYELNA